MSTPRPHADATPTGRDIETARTFPVARDALFAAFADPAVLASWWGPSGSANTFETFDLRPGGAWRFVMRAADGTAYAMENEFVEVVAPERVVIRHRQAGHGFELRIAYEALDAARTRVRWRMRFDDPAEGERVRAFVAEANEQNLDRLEAALGLPPGRAGAPAA